MGAGRVSLAVAVAFALCATAHGAAYQVQARTEAQAYQIRAFRNTGPDDPVLLPRRRVVQSLGLNVYELLTGQDLGFESSLRIAADFGLPRGEAATIDGLRAEEADLLYANLRYRSGRLSLRLGRQLYGDTADLLAFDGLHVRYVTGLGLGLEAFGGLWVKGAYFLSSPVYQPDGTRESDARRLAEGVATADPALDDLEPLLGAKLIFQRGGLLASAGYRSAWLGGEVDLQRAVADVRYVSGGGLSVFGGAEYDLFLMQLSQLRALVRYDAAGYAASAELMRLEPVLSAQSIWYYFAHGPRDEGRLRLDLYPSGPLRYYAQATVGRYNTVVNSSIGLSNWLTALPTDLNVGGALGGSLRAGALRAGLDVTHRQGFGGQQTWVDLTAGLSPQGAFTFDGRLSLANVRDGYNPLLRGLFVGVQLWATAAVSESTRLSAVLEQNVSRFTRSDTKVFLLFDVMAGI